MPRRRPRGSGKRRARRQSQRKSRQRKADPKQQSRRESPQHEQLAALAEPSEQAGRSAAGPSTGSSRRGSPPTAPHAEPGGECRTTRARPTTRHPASGRPNLAAGLWQVWGSAALSAAGSTAGLTRVVHELGYHVPHPAQAVGVAGASLCLGVIVGLWLPRHVIRQRLTPEQRVSAGGDHPRHPGAVPRHEPGGVELGFAASLAGSLLFALAITWLLICGGAAGMESYRAFVAASFVLPLAVARAAVLMPACLALVLLGAVGTTALVGLRGWLRLLSGPDTNHTPLWIVMLLAAALSAGVMTTMQSTGALMLATLLPVFAAAIVAVLRRSRGVGSAGPRAARSGEGLGLCPWLVALVATLSGGLAGILALAGGSLGTGELGRAAAALTGGAAVGLLLARAGLRRWAAAALTPLFLLTSAVFWAFAQRWSSTPATTDLLRLVGVAGCATACLSLVGSRLAVAYGSPQLAFARVTGLAATAGLLAALLAIGWGPRLDPGTLLVVVVLASTATAGLALLFDAAVSERIRAAGLVGIVAWLAVVLLLGDFPVREGGARRPNAPVIVERPAQRVVRGLYESPGAGGVRVAARRASTPRDVPSAWEIDFGGPRHEVVVVVTNPATGHNAAPSRREGRRLVRRCAAAMAHGGHLVFELPAGELALAAQDVARNRRETHHWSSYVLRVSGENDHHDVLLVGPGVPAWVRQHPWPEGFESALHEVPRRRDLERMRSGVRSQE